MHFVCEFYFVSGTIQPWIIDNLASDLYICITSFICWTLDLIICIWISSLNFIFCLDWTPGSDICLHLLLYCLYTTSSPLSTFTSSAPLDVSLLLHLQCWFIASSTPLDEIIVCNLLLILDHWYASSTNHSWTIVFSHRTMQTQDSLHLEFE